MLGARQRALVSRRRSFELSVLSSFLIVLSRQPSLDLTHALRPPSRLLIWVSRRLPQRPRTGADLRRRVATEPGGAGEAVRRAARPTAVPGRRPGRRPRAAGLVGQRTHGLLVRRDRAGPGRLRVGRPPGEHVDAGHRTGRHLGRGAATGRDRRSLPAGLRRLHSLNALELTYSIRHSSASSNAIFGDGMQVISKKVFLPMRTIQIGSGKMNE